jgi:hypothetical protein
MRKNQIIENLIYRLKRRLVTERKSDEISLKLSRLVISQFKKDEDFELYDLRFDRGDEYAVFDFKCYFLEDVDLDDPFSIHAEADMEEIFMEITFNPQHFPESMEDLVAEVKETIEHELEHVEQQNFEDMDYEREDDFEYDDEEYNFKYLTSKVEIPAYVRGLIKRSKTKKTSLEDAMEEWFKENKKKFKNPEEEWSKVKKIWMDYANEMRDKEKIKKFK